MVDEIKKNSLTKLFSLVALMTLILSSEAAFALPPLDEILIELGYKGQEVFVKDLDHWRDTGVMLYREKRMLWKTSSPSFPDLLIHQTRLPNLTIGGFMADSIDNGDRFFQTMLGESFKLPKPPQSITLYGSKFPGSITTLLGGGPKRTGFHEFIHAMQAHEGRLHGANRTVSTLLIEIEAWGSESGASKGRWLQMNQEIRSGKMDIDKVHALVAKEQMMFKLRRYDVGGTEVRNQTVAELLRRAGHSSETIAGSSRKGFWKHLLPRVR